MVAKIEVLKPLKKRHEYRKGNGIDGRIWEGDKGDFLSNKTSVPLFPPLSSQFEKKKIKNSFLFIFPSFFSYSKQWFREDKKNLRM